MVSFAIMVPLNMLFAIMVGSYHNRKFAIMVFAIMVGSYHNRKFAIMVFAIMVWNPFYYPLGFPVALILYLKTKAYSSLPCNLHGTIA